MQKVKGQNHAQIAKLIEREKIEIELPEIPRFFKLREVNKYVDCPLYRSSFTRRALIDCYTCSFFYKIKIVPKTKCEFVLCSFREEEDNVR